MIADARYTVDDEDIMIVNHTRHTAHREYTVDDEDIIIDIIIVNKHNNDIQPERIARNDSVYFSFTSDASETYSWSFGITMELDLASLI